jgi:hypothetical protein
LPKDSELVFPRGYRELEHFSRTDEESCSTFAEPETAKHIFDDFPSLGCNHDLPLHKRHLARSETPWTQTHRNTMKYAQLVTFKDDEFDVATATTVEEAKKTLAVSFEYVTEKNGIMLFRRPKRLGATVG